ncbi:hypothetical protein GCM10010978_07380 [Compostibacillus humi]|uniref:Actin-like protein N-terminal domain-containing protein n=1 Tax=Compostibacillus humi TaxID=1245525 RepID=A0A8J2ZPK5_9BACI|nr:hypothetical protein [Compostibacillus humi]GGH71441.1 hypothetical protein GCM10010978_07380 [Compostibacillus humi]
MENQRIVAVDIGNSWFKSLISDQGALYEYQFPNAVALFDEEFYEEPYDEEDVLLEENIIVELNSPSITEKRQVYYARKSALKMKNVSLTSIHNQKVTEDRTYTLLFAMMAYHAIQTNPGETELDFTVDQLAVSLPTTQYKTKKDLFKNKLLGTHRIVFHKVPGIDAPKEIAVKLHIEDVIIGAEGACA